MIRHSLSFWQLITLIAAIAVIVPIPPAWIGGQHTSVLNAAARHGEAYVEAARDWSADAESDLRVRLYPHAHLMGRALSSLADEWAAEGAWAAPRLGTAGLAGLDLWSLLPDDLFPEGAAG